jgi:hypothetical protein
MMPPGVIGFGILIRGKKSTGVVKFFSSNSRYLSRIFIKLRTSMQLNRGVISLQSQKGWPKLSDKGRRCWRCLRE